MELVILAAGMGSRFGGLKQIEPVGPSGEFIIDYSIYDAIRFGFDKVIFIIKEENYKVFRNTIGKRIENKIKIEYVFQKNDNVPYDVKLPNDRVKPLGTAHAILCCKDVVKSNFAIINADDFYGKDAFKIISEFLKNNNKTNKYAMVGYKVSNTLTENGAVKRGVCELKNNFLKKIIESSIEKVNNKIVASPLDGSESFEVSSDSLVSMNLFGFTPNIFGYLESRFESFLKDNKYKLDKCEYLIPDVVFEQIKNNDVTVEVLKTNAVWHGMTYKEDKEDLSNSIKDLISKGEYPDNLWS
ncbi:MAG: sugar phosphate nucleotidyltransferase [bacterium]|nr:sugar phosphate nucleotidyltransferase [bacterium]